MKNGDSMDWENVKDESFEFQGKSQKQVKDSENAVIICFVAGIIVIAGLVISAIKVG